MKSSLARCPERPAPNLGGGEAAPWASPWKRVAAEIKRAAQGRPFSVLSQAATRDYAGFRKITASQNKCCATDSALQNKGFRTGTGSPRNHWKAEEVTPMAEARVMKESEQDTELTEAQIAVHWREEQYYYPSAKFIGQANLSDPAVNERFGERNFPECYREYADLLSWDHYWHTTLDTSDAPFWKWFVGGQLNVAYNCVDRHLEKY